MGFLACLPVPIVNTLVAGFVMMCVYPATARKGPPFAVENARNAANWGLTVVVGTVAIVAYKRSCHPTLPTSERPGQRATD